MNTLTILIYIGSLISSLELILGSFIILSTLGFIFYLLICAIEEKTPKVKGFLFVYIPTLVVTIVIPGPEAYWLMVGSEVSEAVLNMPEVDERLQKILNILDLNLDKLEEASK
jgi:hypothetical protein